MALRGEIEMARPIEPTPTLKGKSVDLFCRSITNVEYSPQKDRLLKEAREIHKELNKHRQSFPSVLKGRDD